jgi:hypothetical protein
VEGTDRNENGGKMKPACEAILAIVTGNPQAEAQ